tara:strand:- start:1532 stop:1987 length:456 start_codon:yes stop_codon:yes gene_type:complete
MSFQKAHQISNELGEVIVQTVEDDLSSTGQLALTLPPQFKSYRVLELGIVTTNATGSTGVDITFGNAAGGAQFVGDGTPVTFTIAAEKGVTYSTASGAFAFNAAGTGSVDSDGVPALEKGEGIHFTVTGVASAATTAVAFARLAPNIEYKD